MPNPTPAITLASDATPQEELTADRPTAWYCSYCGNEATGEPSIFRCCGEIGHAEQWYTDTNEPVEP